MKTVYMLRSLSSPASPENYISVHTMVGVHDFYSYTDADNATLFNDMSEVEEIVTKYDLEVELVTVVMGS